MRWRFLSAAVGIVGCFLLFDTALLVCFQGGARWTQAASPKTAKAWLRDLRNAGDPCRRARATDALWQFGPRIVPEIATCLHHKSTQVRSSACIALARMGRHASSAVPELSRLVASPTEPTRIEAIQALEQIGPSASPAIQVLATAARDREATVRRAAIAALGQIGQSAIPALLTVVRESDPPSRAWAIEALAQTRSGSPDVAMAVAAYAVDRDESMRNVAFNALVAQRAGGVIPLQHLLQHEDATVRRQAARCLCKLGPVAQAAANSLLAATNDQDAAVRFWALRALRTLSLDEVAERESLQACLTDPDPDVRWQAAETWAHTGPAAGRDAAIRSASIKAAPADAVTAHNPGDAL